MAMLSAVLRGGGRVKAVKAAIGPDYFFKDRQKDWCGFDLLFKDAITGQRRHAEAKGTKNPVARFFISRNDDEKGKVDAGWELAVVTDAHGDAGAEFLSYLAMEAAFDRVVLWWHATRTLR